MLVKDPKKEFYDKIQHQRVLILVTFDVDALCACNILQYLFQCDQVLYTVVPVTGKQDLENSFLENSEGIKHILMLNCGATIDIIELLQPDDDVCFYICDSHRPVDVHNVYNGVQVKLLMKDEEMRDIPDYDDVFRDDEDDESDAESNDEGEQLSKRKRYSDEYILKRRERRQWEENRNKTLFEYTQFSSFGSSAALLMFEIAWRMSKDTNDLVWLGIIGVTDQLVHYRISREKYIEDVMTLQSHVSRHNFKEGPENNQPINSLKISFEDELQLTLYRHWSLFESICKSVTTACKFKVWSMKGRKRLHEFLAEMGLPLIQCQQKYSAMEPSLRNNVKELIQKHIEKYGFAPEDIVIPSFNAQYGYRNKLCASDVVLACCALLESPQEKNQNATDSFFQAMDILNRKNTKEMEEALNMAKKQIGALASQVQTFLDMQQVMSAGPFLYAFVQEGTLEAKCLSKPQCLQRLARFTLEAYSAERRSKKTQYLPLVLGVPLDAEQQTSLVIGIPPLNLDDERKNFFGKAFEQAAVTTNSRTLHNYFDNYILQMNTEDRGKFFDALINLLQ